MRRNDPGLMGGMAVQEEGRNFGMIVAAIVLVGLAFGYLASLHGVAIDEKSLVGFAFWSIAAMAVCFLVTWLFKYVFILTMLLVGALWWTDNPVIREASVQVRELKDESCQRLTLEVEGVPYKEWICE